MTIHRSTWPRALAVLLLAALMGAPITAAAPSPVTTVADGRVLYSPDLDTHPRGDAGYPRLIRLEHDGNGGDTLLATFANIKEGVPGNLPIYRSTDAGRTWSHVSSISSNTSGWDLVAPVIYEVPHDAQGLNTGDLLASGTAWALEPTADFSAQKIEVFKSTDHGQTWDYLSSCTETSGLPNEIGHGIWEPWFVLADNGTLACFISDERPPGRSPNNQIIGHYTSTDGGQTWSQDITLDLDFRPDDSGVDDELARPGMSIITPLPNGEYLMAYEMCRDAIHADYACEVYIKKSADGLDWSPADDPGTLVQTSDARHLLHTPYVAWSPAGGPNGTLLISGQRVTTGPTTPDKTVMPESGKVLLANTELGEGPWHEITAPLSVDPTGGYASGVPQCPGYSSPILPSPDGEEILMMAGTWLAGTGNQCEVRFGFGQVGTLPYELPLGNVKEGFAEYGGTWQVSSGILSVTDSVAGPKAVTGSEAWTDYTAAAEVRLDGGGQAGLVTRLSAPAPGADAHRGYYAGLDSSSNQLVFGKQDNDWTQLSSAPVSGGVDTSAWYELSVQSEGCRFTVTAQSADGSAASTTINVTDPNCFRSGAIGVRSHFTPASWRSIDVTP